MLAAYWLKGQNLVEHAAKQPEYSSLSFIIVIDGISLFLIMLTTFLIPVCILVGWKSVSVYVKEYCIAVPLFLPYPLLLFDVSSAVPPSSTIHKPYIRPEFHESVFISANARRPNSACPLLMKKAKNPAYTRFYDTELQPAAGQPATYIAISNSLRSFHISLCTFSSSNICHRLGSGGYGCLGHSRAATWNRAQLHRQCLQGGSTRSHI